MNTARFLIVAASLFVAGLLDAGASIPKNRVGDFFDRAPVLAAPESLQVAELHLENLSLYDWNASGSTLWTKFDPEGLKTKSQRERNEKKLTKSRDREQSRLDKAKNLSEKSKEKLQSKIDGLNEKIADERTAISAIEATAKKWNEAAGKEVLNVEKLNDETSAFGILSLYGPGQIQNPAVQSALYKEMGIKNPSQQTGSLLGKMWNLPNTAMGLAAGMAGLPFGANITFGDNAIQFLNYPFGNGGALTLGNVQLYNNSSPATTDLRYDRTGPVVWGRHEEGHTLQGERMGPGYLPGYFYKGGINSANPMETGADNYGDGTSMRP